MEILDTNYYRRCYTRTEDIGAYTLALDFCGSAHILNGYARIAAEVLQNNEYSGDENEISARDQLIETLINAMKYPCQEQLIKMGWYCSAAYFNNIGDEYKKDKSLPEVLNLKKGQLKHLKAIETNKKPEYWRNLIENNNENTENKRMVIQGIKEGLIPEECIVLELYAQYGPSLFAVLRKYIEYGKNACHFMLAARRPILQEQKKNIDLTEEQAVMQAYLPTFYSKTRRSSFMGMYYDYICMAEEMNLHTDRPYPIFLKPSQVTGEHNKITREYNRMKDLDKCRADSLLVEQFSQKVKKPAYHSLEYTDETYSIIAPKCPEDILEEGRLLGHCVGTYWKDVARGYTKILFLRFKAAITEPYCTIEVKNKQIRQCYNVDDTHDKNKSRIEFIKKWAAEKKLEITCDL